MGVFILVRVFIYQRYCLVSMNNSGLENIMNLNLVVGESIEYDPLQSHKPPLPLGEGWGEGIFER